MKFRLSSMLLVLCVAAGLLSATSAMAATKAVSITKTGFVPDVVSISKGDSVTWTNNDTVNHQVVGKANAFSSPVLKPGETYSHVFAAAGKYMYTDGLVKGLQGEVDVSTPSTPALSLTFTASSTAPVTFGRTVTFSGVVSNQKAGESVTILAQPSGQNAPQAIATVTTTAGGSFSYVARPGIRTVYSAKLRNATAAGISISVRPRVTLVRRIGGRFATSVTAATSFAGKTALFERHSARGWVVVKRVVLSSTSKAVFRARLPRGRSLVRVLFPRTQAGAGYLSGISRTITVRR